MNPPRGMYRIRPAAFATAAPATFGCVVLARLGGWMLVHSHINPNPAIEGLGGEYKGSTWAEMKGNVSVAMRMRAFRKVVTLNTGTAARTISVPMDDMRGGSVQNDWLPSHKFLGDPKPDRVPDA